ncbi:HB2L protein, partial [Pitta sordida]|nr:HB2L protein [Pitta sordida]
PAQSGMFQLMAKDECHFINGTIRVRFVDRYIYNRQQLAHFNSDVGEFVGDTPFGEKVARDLNNRPEYMEYKRTAVDWYCWTSYEVFALFSVERRVPHSPAQSLP